MYCIEKIKGEVKFTYLNLFLENVTDMMELEFWEDRLERLEEPYAVVYKKVDNAYRYYLYCNIARKGSKFKDTYSYGFSEEDF